MFSLLIVIAIILILAILLLLFRISTLVSVMKGAYRKPVGTSNRVNAILFIVFLVLGFGTFIWYSLEAQDQYLPEAVSIHGKDIDLMFWVTMGILTAAFLLVNFFLFYFAYKYQYKEGKQAYYFPENNKLEIVWTVIPAIILAILVFYGWSVWAKITDAAPKNAEVVEIMGFQFAWQVRYPGQDGNLGDHDYRLIDAVNQFGIDFTDPNSLDDFSPPELHIPKGQPVLLKIRARDVIHSVFLPHFRVKMDAVPGVPTTYWFTPTKTTREMRDELGDPDFNYELACTEICGRGHFSMRFVVVVDEPQEYERWKREQQSIAEMNADYVQEVVPQDLWDQIPGLDPEATEEEEGADPVSEVTTDEEGTEGEGETQEGEEETQDIENNDLSEDELEGEEMEEVNLESSSESLPDGEDDNTEQ